MAERLTIRHGNRTDCNTLCMEDCDHCWHLGIIREKLARLEDLEEQGKLITLPCKIGDTVYGVTRFPSEGDERFRVLSEIRCGVVSEMYFTSQNRLQILIENVCCGYWGENIFGTMEEAEAALKEVDK